MAKYYKPHRIKRKKSIFKKRSFWLSILFSAFFIFTIYFLFFSQFFLIKEIKIFGGEEIEKEKLKNFVEENLTRKILIFQTKNIFLVNFDKIKSEILEKFPEIDDLEFKRQFPDKLKLIIKERKKVAKFCQKENCFLIDEKGIAFKKATLENQLLKIESEVFGGNLNLGEKIIEEELVKKILEVEKKLKDLNIFLKKVLIISEDNLHFKTDEDWEIFIDPQKDIEWQITKLDVSLKEAIPKEKRKNLEYIDLRFGNFAYPKYK